VKTDKKSSFDTIYFPNYELRILLTSDNDNDD